MVISTVILAAAFAALHPILIPDGFCRAVRGDGTG